MRKTIARLASCSLLLFFTIISFAQNVTLPAKLKSQCDAIAQDDKLKIAVAKFTKTNNEIPDKYNDVFSAVLFNSLYQSNCFRVFSMPDPALTPFTGDTSQSSHVPDAQFIITGEMTQFSTSIRTRSTLMGNKTTTTALIGFILQVKPANSQELLMTKIINEEGSSEAKQSSFHVILPVHVPGTLTSDNNYTLSSDQGTEKAYSEAFEKGIVDAVSFILENRGKMVAAAATAVTTDTGGEAVGRLMTIIVENASFPKLVEIENILKSAAGVSKVVKKMSNNEGNIQVNFSGTDDDLVNLLTSKMADSLDVTGFEPGKITVRVK